MDLVAKTVIWTFVGFIAFWVSLGLFAGAPWDGVIGACLISALVMPLVYLYARWLQRRLGRGASDREERDLRE